MIAAAAGAATGLATPLRSARAQTSAWPSKPIRIIVGFAPGGLTDAYARMFAEQITARYNQPVIVENRLGAGGNIAATEIRDHADTGSLGEQRRVVDLNGVTDAVVQAGLVTHGLPVRAYSRNVVGLKAGLMQ
jgi:hypothetical protein